MFSGEYLVTDFQQWRFPVTDKSVLEVATRYDLKRVCAATDDQFAKEYADGKVHLDPLSLQVRVNKAADGKAQATIFSILRSNPGVVVRYTLDNSPVTAASKIDSGTPFPLPARATVKAAMFTPGNAQPVLTATSKVAPN
jgi:hypothetical protein